MKKDINTIWQKIEDAFDKDESLNSDEYAKKKGWKNIKNFNSANESVSNLLNSAFSDQEPKQDDQLTKYRIIDQLDSGGQSDIYLAERNDGVYQQKVVIKFIAQRYNFEALKHQFMQEMQLLADLKHPGVVPILDGNITDKGQPWLVLEYIDGLHIDSYCIKNNIDTKNTVQLIINLCDTLDFIHQRKIIHKDIKPSNVLIKNINGVPYPILIDFGIAMDSKQNTSEMVFGTFGYSSPEQLENKTIDNRTDIYSLGVLMLQLLFGKEFDLVKAEKNFTKYISDSSIPKDLKTIIANCIQHHSNKRYQSTTALRNDLNNWLLGYPISTNSHKIGHFFIKVIKRNKILSSVFLLLFLSGIVVAIKYANDINHLQSLTLKEKNATNELMNYMLDDLYDNLERIGRVDVLQSVVNKSVNHLKSQDLAVMDKTGYTQTAKAFINAGQVYNQLQQNDKANLAFEQAETYLKKLKLIPSESNNYHRLLAKLKILQSEVLSSENQQEKTEEALLIAINSAVVLPENNEEFLWEAYLLLGYHYIEYALSEKAQQIIAKSVLISETFIKDSPENAQWLYKNSHSYQLLSLYELDFGGLENAISSNIKAIERGLKAISFDDSDLKKHNNIRILYNQIGFLYLEQGENLKAIDALYKALQFGLELKIKAPFNQKFQRELSYSYSTIGEAYKINKQPQKALINFEKGLKISREIYQKNKNDFSSANDLSIDLIHVASIQKSVGNIDQHFSLLSEAHEIMSLVHQHEPENKYYTHTYASLLLMLDNRDKAIELIKQLVKSSTVDSYLMSLIKKHKLEYLLENNAN